MRDAAKRQGLTPLRDWTVPPTEEACAASAIRGLPPDPPAPCSPGGVSEYGLVSDAATSSHDCVCLHAPGYRPKVCGCSVYEDEHGRWCGNENCRAYLGEPRGAS